MAKRNRQELEAAIDAVQAKLQHEWINHPCNTAVRHGYTEAVRVLTEQVESYTSIQGCYSVQSRAIAVLAVDYLLGECSLEVLCSVPVKQLSD